MTPAGPADKAGLKAGDIITSFNGTALGGIKSDDEDEIRTRAQIDRPRAEARCRGYRDGPVSPGAETRTARIIAEDVKMSMRMSMPHMQDLPRTMKMPDFDGDDGDFRVFINDRFSDLDLVDLEPRTWESTSVQDRGPGRERSEAILLVPLKGHAYLKHPRPGAQERLPGRADPEA